LKVKNLFLLQVAGKFLLRAISFFPPFSLLFPPFALKRGRQKKEPRPLPDGVLLCFEYFD